MLETSKHEIVMKKILSDIYSHPSLRANLGFKGGTCLYFFYDLNRFSTDLDFNLLGDTLEVTELTKIISKHLEIAEQREKHFTWFWQGSYTKGSHRIKIEISKRDFPDTYITKDFYGLSLTTMSPDCMFAHKLCAISDRKTLQNRDLYDSWFMFDNNFVINEEIIKIRTGKSTKDYFQDLIKYIEKETSIQHSILDGLGEVLNQSQKDWVKTQLLSKLLFELKIRSK